MIPMAIYFTVVNFQNSMKPSVYLATSLLVMLLGKSTDHKSFDKWFIMVQSISGHFLLKYVDTIFSEILCLT